MMTELEAVAQATAFALGENPSEWGKAEASKASAFLQGKLAKGDLDAETFAKALIRVTGNHSQRRQLLISWGILPVNEKDSAEKREIVKAFDTLDKARKAALDDVK